MLLETMGIYFLLISIFVFLIILFVIIVVDIVDLSSNQEKRNLETSSRIMSYFWLRVIKMQKSPSFWGCNFSESKYCPCLYNKDTYYDLLLLNKYEALIGYMMGPKKTHGLMQILFMQYPNWYLFLLCDIEFSLHILSIRCTMFLI